MNPLDIAAHLADRQEDIEKLLVLGVLKNGDAISLDTGLTAEEARDMLDDFRSWIDMCLGRELERNKHGEV